MDYRANAAPHDDFNSIGHRGLHGNLPMNTESIRAASEKNREVLELEL